MTEVETKLMELYINNLKKTIELTNSIVIPVINSFDGKVYNVRLENTIQGKLPESVFFHVRDFDYRHMRIELGFWNKYREVYVMETYFGETKEHRQVHYLPHGWEDITICYKYTDFNTWENNKKTNGKYYFKDTTDAHFYIDDNYKTRINSSVIVEKIKEKLEDIQETIRQLEDILKNNKVDYWKGQLEDIKKQAESLHSEIPCVVRDICKISSYATWN